MTQTPHQLEGTNAGDSDPPHVGKTLWLIIIACLGVYLGCLTLSHSVFENWRWENQRIHGSIETAGGVIALLVALLLLSLDRQHIRTSFNTWVACGLVSIGLLDGVHAVVPVGQSFVWLHSLATFLGGLLFSMVLLPHRCLERVTHGWVWGVFLSVLSIAVFSIAWPSLTPPMLVLGPNGTLRFSKWPLP